MTNTLSIGAKVLFTNPETNTALEGVIIAHDTTRDRRPEYTGNREWYVQFDAPIFEGASYDRAFCAGKDLQLLEP